MAPKSGNKRKASTKADKQDTKVKQPKQDGQKAVSKRDLEIPIDEMFNGNISLWTI